MELEYFPIKNLTTYTSNWTIKARILEKAPLRQIKGDNHLMHIDVVDKHGDSIRVKFWGKAATKWDEVLQKGKVYTFSKGTVELSNKRFNTTPHNYEITCHQESIIEPVEDAGDITLQRDHKLLTLRDIKTMPNVTQAPVDLLCIVNAVQPAANVTTKAGKEISKRVVMLVDDTGYEMELTLWAEHANNEAVEQMEGKAVIAEKVIIREWQGARSCQTLSSSEVQLATRDNIRDHTRLSQLQKWFEDAKAKNETFKTMRPQAVSARDQYELADMVTVADKTKGGYIVKGKLRKIFWKNKDGVAKMWYQACPMCTKKVIMDGDDNRYKCISCGDVTVVPVPRYMFYCNFTDHTGRLTAQIATDIGEKLLGKTAKELEEMDPDKLKRFCDFEATHRDYKVSGYIKTRVYNGETKHNFTVTRVEPLDYAAEAALMLENMRITYDDVLKFLDIKTDERDSKKARV